MNVPHSVMRAKATAMAAVEGVMKQSTRYAKFDEEVGRSTRSVVSSTDIRMTGSTPKAARKNSRALSKTLSSTECPNSSSAVNMTMETAADGSSGDGDILHDMSVVQGLLCQQYLCLESTDAKRDFEDRWG